MDQNMTDLMNAAKLKLEAQQKQEDGGEDIYAAMRAEMEEEPEVQYAPPQYSQSNYDIEYESQAEEDYYIDPDDTPIFDGGPGISQIDLWKKQYTKEKIFHTQILDKHFVFRPDSGGEVGVEGVRRNPGNWHLQP